MTATANHTTTGWKVSAPGTRAVRPVLALIVLCLAEMLVLLDNAIVNVALPSMSTALQGSFSSLQWIVDAYVLTFAGLLLAFGHLGDRYGRRKVMVIGLVGVGVMSLAGAFVGGIGQIIAVRAGMGVFAAAVFPATLALLTGLFSDPRARAAAIAAWTAMAGVAIALGPTVGGWLLEHFSWRSVFWINVPLAAALVVAALLLVPESRAPHSGPLDVLGIVLSLSGITALVWAIIEAPHNGWTSQVTLTGYGVALACLALFVWRELKAPYPVLNLRLLTNRRFSFPALSITVAYFSMFGFLFLITQYFQGVREYSPLEFGLHSLPFALSVGLAAPIAVLLAQRFGTTAVIVTGLLILAVGMYIAGQVTIDSPYVGTVLISMVLMGLGLAIVQGPATEAIMSAVPEDEVGAGAGVNDTTREVGGALGVAVLGSIVASSYKTQIWPIVDKIPDTLANATDKEFMRQTAMSIIGLREKQQGSMFASQIEGIITNMKVAVLDGFHIASYVTVGAVLVCAVVVAIALPWRRDAAQRSMLLGWADKPKEPESTRM
ncbi:MFS transporter [Antrihabitans spumae]|uniref:MFS transporter n=1 Tax=Antrihabitans spumae TaxID=3373370 RepID=A0ABW7KTP9_9NOCA